MPRTTSISFGAAALLLLAQALSAGQAQAQIADTVLFNGKVLTMDQDFSVREALAIDHGRVLATGTSQDMQKLAGANARLIDLGGRTVIPELTMAISTGCAPRRPLAPSQLDRTSRRSSRPWKKSSGGANPETGSWIIVAGG